MGRNIILIFSFSFYTLLLKILLDESVQQEIELKCQIVISLSTTVEHTSPQYLYVYTSHANMLTTDGDG